MKRRLILILIWGGVCLSTSTALLITMVVTYQHDFWLVPTLGVGLPTLGLALALLGFIPGTRPPVDIFVRLLPPQSAGFARVKGVRIRGGLFRIVSQNSENLPWEFLTGERVQCSECVLPSGESGLVAVIRI